MKLRNVTLLIVFFHLSLLSTTSFLQAQNNFQISPPPIAYPYFEPRRTDVKLSGTYFGIKADDVEIKGGGASGILRVAFNEVLAFDSSLGLYAQTGELPGIALPFFFSGNFWTPVIDGKADLSGLNLPLSFNLEIQLMNRPGASLLLFAGPNLSLATMSIETPYHAVSGVTVASRTTFTVRSTSFLGGGQGGVQAGLRFGPVMLAPFFMMVSQGGSSSFTFENGYRSTDNLVEDSVVDIEPFVTTSYGADIIIVPWNLSIGTLLQQASSTTNQDGYKTVLINLSWHFRTK